MPIITRLRRVSWKSKNNVYGLSLANKELLGSLEEYMKLHFDDLNLDILIVPVGLKRNATLIEEYFPGVEIIGVGIEGKDDVQSGFLVDESVAIEIAQDILKVDAIEVGLYSGASAKVAVDRGEKYDWKNIGILLFIDDDFSFLTQD